MQPEVYPLSDHQITHEMIDKDALYVLEKLRSAGHMAYLVGGSVRDLLLGHTPKDFDISTSAKPEEIKALFRNCLLIGRRFRLAHIRFGRKVLEVSTFRSGDPTSDTLILRDNEWGTAEEDVERRDFTINGLYYDSFEQTVIDYVGGYPDIQRKTLQTIGQPYLRFKQDPVRMIRLLKFVARFHFDVDPKTRQALLDCQEEIIKSAPARVLEELFRMLESSAAEKFIRLMTDHGILQMLLPEISRFLETPDGATVFSYLSEIDALTKEENKPLDRAILLSSLVFPLLEKQIQTHLASREEKPHLGEIHELTSDVVHQVFDSFFKIPRRIKGSMISLLTSQYRITPLVAKVQKRIRVPKIPDFLLAIEFLKLRNRIEPSLNEICAQWLEAVEGQEESTEVNPKRKRRRSRRRRKEAP